MFGITSVRSMFEQSGNLQTYLDWLYDPTDTREPWEMFRDELSEIYLRTYAAMKIQGKDVSKLPKPKLERAK